MRSRARAGLAGLLLGVTVPWSLPLPACASSSGHAALVVDAGDESQTYRLCVQLPDDSVSGIELIQLAGEQHGLAYELGNGGQTVCMLAGVGSSSGNECFGEYPDFWGYWRGEGGGWEWSGTGAASTIVEPGDVEGWSWGRGQDGSTHPAPPATRFEDVCAGVAEPPRGSEKEARSIAEPPRDAGRERAPEPRTAAPDTAGNRAVRQTTRSDIKGEASPRGRARPDIGKRQQVSSDAAAGRTTSDERESDQNLPAVASEPSDTSFPRGALVAGALATLLIGLGIRTARRRGI